VLFSRLPSFSLLAASVLLMVGFPLWINPDTWRYSKGIQVLISSRGRMTPRYGQWSKPMTLRIDKHRRWFLEGQPVSPEEFPAALQQALNRRPDPFVCVDADPSLDYQYPGRAMDMIQGMYVKVIIATPKTVDDGCTATIGR
jgi:biopolymer transport protein ExbD